MGRLFKILSIIVLTIILIFLVFYSYVIFVNPNILDFSTDEFNALKSACDEISIESEVQDVMNNAKKNNLLPLLKKDYLAIKNGDCSCRLEYKNNRITKKYIAACEVQQ